MKTFITLVLMSLALTGVKGQKEVNPFLEPEFNPPTVYLGLSTGLENMIGLIGPQIEIVASKPLRIGGGIGISSWGTKWAVNLQYYPKDWYKLFFKTGYSRNSGLDDFETELKLVSGSMEDVRLNLNPVDNLFVTIGYAWKVGKRNKFYLEGGYAIPLTTEDYYTLLDPVELHSDAKNELRTLRPGGLVLAVGINFAVGNK